MQVLLNHVVVGALPSDAILGVLGDADDGTTTVSTLLGGDLVVSTVDGTIFVRSGGIEAPGAAVETADVETCAGVVHVIDTVLLPGDSAESPATEEEMAPATAPEAVRTHMDLLLPATLDGWAWALLICVPRSCCVLQIVAAADPCWAIETGVTGTCIFLS